jgi:membrane protein EpsK
MPAGLEFQTQVLFTSVAITMLVAMLGANFGVSSLITHRFDLNNAVRALSLLVRVGVVIACFWLWPVSLFHISAGFLASAFVGLIGDALVWRRLTPQLHIDRRAVNRRQFREVLGLSVWSLANSSGLLLLSEMNLIIVNAIFGAEATGRYGLILLFPTLIESLAATVVNVLSPAIMARYAAGDTEGLIAIASRSVKLLAVVLALPIGLLCGFSRPLLRLWLGPEFAELDFLLILLVGHLTLNVAVRPLLYVITAFNRMRAQAVATLVCGVANVILALILTRWSGLGLAGIAAAPAIVWTIKNVGFLSGYSSVLLGLRWWTFFIPLAPGGLSMLGVAGVSAVVLRYWQPESWLSLGLQSCALALAYGGIAYVFCLNPSDRVFLRSFFWRASSA